MGLVGYELGYGTAVNNQQTSIAARHPDVDVVRHTHLVTG